jgi:hypothetical protein
MAYAICETTNLRATHYGERIFDFVCDELVENGTFGYFETLADGESNVYKFVKGFKEGCPVVMAHNPEWTEDTCRMTNQRKDKFAIEAGVRFRGFVMKENDEFAVNIDGFTPATQSVVAGVTDFTANTVYATIDATTGKLVAATAPVDGAVMEVKIERKRLQGATLVTAVRDYGRKYDMYECMVKVLA